MKLRASTVNRTCLRFINSINTVLQFEHHSFVLLLTPPNAAMTPPASVRTSSLGANLPQHHCKTSRARWKIRTAPTAFFIRSRASFSVRPSFHSDSKYSFAWKEPARTQPHVRTTASDPCATECVQANKIVSNLLAALGKCLQETDETLRWEDQTHMSWKA